MIAAGRLRNRVTIERVTEAADAVGGLTQTWGEWAARWADVFPAAGGEFFRGDREVGSLRYRFVLRWDPQLRELSPKDRIRFHGRLYDIESVVHLEHRRQEVHLCATVREYAGTGG